MTSPEDVALAVAAGADAVGVILAESPRRVSLDRLAALAGVIPPFVTRVGVLADQGEPEACALRELGFTLQFSGDESPETCATLARGAPYLKAFHLDAAAPQLDLERYARYAGALWLFDTASPQRRGGTGLAFEARTLASLARERAIVLSGGLRPDTVGAAVAALHPYAVDVRSGIESGGRKDERKMRDFVAAVRAASA